MLKNDSGASGRMPSGMRWRPAHFSEVVFPCRCPLVSTLLSRRNAPALKPIEKDSSFALPSPIIPTPEPRLLEWWKIPHAQKDNWPCLFGLDITAHFFLSSCVRQKKASESHGRHPPFPAAAAVRRESRALSAWGGSQPRSVRTAYRWNLDCSDHCLTGSGAALTLRALQS
jgi:hypothetical protein